VSAFYKSRRQACERIARKHLGGTWLCVLTNFNNVWGFFTKYKIIASIVVEYFSRNTINTSKFESDKHTDIQQAEIPTQ